VTAPASGRERRVEWAPAFALWVVLAVMGPSPAHAGASDSIGVGRRIAASGRAFFSDLGYAASAPARMTRRSALWTAGILASGAAILAYDDQIQQGFSRSRGNSLYDAALQAGGRLEPAGQMGKTGPFWIAGALLGTAFAIRPLQAVSLDVIESHLVSGVIRNTVKTAVGRSRPSEGGPRRFFGGGTSFPSGHASVAFEVATILSHHLREAPPALRWPVTAAGYGVATTVAIQRVDSGSHWASDVFFAAVSGTVIARVVARRNEERRMALVPLLGADGAPVGVAMKWGF